MIKKDKQDHDQEKKDEALYCPFDEPRIIGIALFDIQARGKSRNKPKDIGDHEQKQVFRVSILRYPLKQVHQYQLDKVKRDKVSACEREPEKARIMAIHGNKLLEVSGS